MGFLLAAYFWTIFIFLSLRLFNKPAHDRTSYFLRRANNIGLSIIGLYIAIRLTEWIILVTSPHITTLPSYHESTDYPAAVYILVYAPYILLLVCGTMLLFRKYKTNPWVSFLFAASIPLTVICYVVAVYINVPLHEPTSFSYYRPSFEEMLIPFLPAAVYFLISWWRPRKATA